jgi:raffinose/stachyose/melibiose transport system substrate-binding protein
MRMRAKRHRSLPVVCLVLCLLAAASVGAGQGEVRLTIWSINPGTSFGELTDQMAARFSENTDGVHLRSVHFDNNFYKSQLRTAMDNRQAPDIFHNWGASSIQSLVEQGRILAVDRIVEQVRDLLLPIALDPVTFSDQVYGLPYSGLAGVFFWYRKDVFARYNLQPPKTWQEFLQVGEKLKENGIIPIALANKNKWPGSFFYMYLVDRIGGPELFRDASLGKDGRSFLDPAFIQAGTMVEELVKREFFPEGFNRMRDESGNWNSLIISGQAGMYLMGTWFLSVINELPEEMRDSFDFFEFPKVSGGLGHFRSLVGSPGQDYLSISADTQDPEKAMSFLREYICSAEYFQALADQGFVPPVHNAEDYLANPLTRKIARIFTDAEHVQLYWDQILPPTQAEAHKLLVHQLFELQISPEQVARGHEDLLGAQGRQ